MKIPNNIYETNQIDITNVQIRYVDISEDGSRPGPDFINHVRNLTVLYPLCGDVLGDVHHDRVVAVELEPHLAITYCFIFISLVIDEGTRVDDI